MKRFAGLIPALGLVFAVACSQTDAGISTAVKSKMAADDTVKAYQFDVDTQNHVVTLTADVQSSAAKDRALAIARGTDGVRDVIDRITVTDAAATSGRLDRDGASPSVSVEIKDDSKAALDKSKSGIEKGVDATANTAEKAGKATVKGAKKLGDKVKDAVTDDNQDSDHDGK